jgi:type IV pilus assembly protein PilZ
LDGHLGKGLVKFPVVSSNRHKSKILEIDPDRELITLIGINGEPLGNLAWDFVIDQILAYRKPHNFGDARSEPRISLSIRVKYFTPEGTQFESRAGGIGGGGLFIESQIPLTVGTKLAIEFSMPESPTEWLTAKGVVAWVCPKADQYTYSPGMGVRFTDIAPETRSRVLNLVHSVKSASQNA